MPDILLVGIMVDSVVVPMPPVESIVTTSTTVCPFSIMVMVSGAIEGAIEVGIAIVVLICLGKNARAVGATVGAAMRDS